MSRQMYRIIPDLMTNQLIAVDGADLIGPHPEISLPSQQMNYQQGKKWYRVMSRQMNRIVLDL